MRHVRLHRLVTRPLLCFLALGTVTAAQAQTFKDGPHFGLPVGGDVKEEKLAVGWQAAYEFNDYASLEVSLTHMEQDLSLPEIGTGPSPGGGVVELETWAVPVLTARLGKLVGERAYVYAGVGIGLYFFTEDAQNVRRVLYDTQPTGPRGGTVTTIGVNVQDNWGAHAAVGCEFHLWDAWELFAEYRHVYFETDSDLRITEYLPDQPFGKRYATTKQSGTYDYDHGLLRVGVNYRF